MSFFESEKVYRAEQYQQHKKLALEKYPGLPIAMALKLWRADNRKEPSFDYKSWYQSNRERIIEKQKLRNKDKTKQQDVAKTPVYESWATSKRGFTWRFKEMEQKGFTNEEIRSMFARNKGSNLYDVKKEG